MIYICADDYGLCHGASVRIQQCVDEGALDKVSVFPNFDRVDLQKILEKQRVRIALHLNLVEGVCMADAREVNLIAAEDGKLKHAFGGLLCCSLFHRKKFEEQAYKEIKAQICFWKSVLPENAPFCLDSHQHTHMIPVVFKVLLRVLREEEIRLKYLRIPAEPILPYLQTPSLYFTYGAVNIVKQWLLKFFWLINRMQAKEYKIPTAHFMGILFSGNMDEKRIRKVLPKYIKLAKKDGRDIEILFHPGYLDKSEPDFKDKNIQFEHFYLSQKRKTEFDAIMKIQKEVCGNALH